MADITVNDQGTIFLITGESAIGKNWIDTYISAESITWGRSVVVEHRYVQDILAGMVADGLKVQAVR